MFRYSVIFQYIYALCNDYSRVTVIIITLSIYHYFVLETFKILSTSDFEMQLNAANYIHPSGYRTL